MPAWRALAIFLFICLLIFFSFAECHRISGPIYCHRPAEHTRRSQPQSDRPLSYSPHRWFLLMVLIAKLSPSHLITSLGARECVCARVTQPDGRCGQCVFVEQPFHRGKMPNLGPPFFARVCVITQIHLRVRYWNYAELNPVDSST